MKGKIIILNGASSTGKTTLAYTLQAKLDEIYYRLSLDDFMKMVDGQKMHDDFFIRLSEILTTMHHTIRLFSDRGLNVIVDHVLLETPEERFSTPEIVTLLNDYPVMFVRVDCNFPELERREQERGDRQIGQLKWQLEHMHSYDMYDLRVNTFKQDIDECVRQIEDLLCQQDKWCAFKALYKHFTL